MSGAAVLGDAVSGAAVLGDAVSGDAVSGAAVLGDAVLGDAVLGVVPGTYLVVSISPSAPTFSIVPLFIPF